MASRGKIPNRWIPYKACGEVIEGTRIICFKVPLHKNVQLKVREIKKIWDVPTVIAEIPKLRAVIDLTNTARYYNPRDFEDANIRHRKILMPGREIPHEHKIQEFVAAVDEFLGKDCDSLIGVHCTHGLNRTGYMVCRYMRDRLNIPAEEAIKKFEKARGYEIEREIYLADLLGKKLPRPDFGKDTVIRPVDYENGVKTSEREYNRYEYEYDRSKCHERSSGYKRYGDSYRSRNSASERDSVSYNSDQNSRHSSEKDDYLSWRKKHDGSNSNGQGYRRSRSRDYFSTASSSSDESDHAYSYKHDY